MNCAALASGVALALAATAAQAQPASHDGVMVDTLARACVEDATDYAGTVQVLGDDGWAVVANDSHPIVKALVAETEALSHPADAPEGWQVLNTTLARQVDGQNYYFMVHGASAPGLAASHACRIINVDATGPVDPQVLQTRLGLGQPQHMEQHGFVVDSWASTPDTPHVTSLYGDPAKADSSVSPVTGVAITLAN